MGGPSTFQRFSSERGLDINILNEGWMRMSGTGNGVAGEKGKRNKSPALRPTAQPLGQPSADSEAR